jgi:hypothetical protein
MDVEITGFTQSSSWYRERIGQVFEVIEESKDIDGNKVYVVHKGRVVNSYIEAKDCEIVNFFTLEQKLPEPNKDIILINGDRTQFETRTLLHTNLEGKPELMIKLENTKMFRAKWAKDFDQKTKWKYKTN